MKNHQTLGQFITSVRLEIDALTCGVVDLDNLVDIADGEHSISDMHANGYTPREAAVDVLESNGFELEGA